MTTEIATITPVADRAAIALNSSQTELALRELATKHADITDIKNRAGREQAHGAAMEVMRSRIAVQTASKTAREDATRFSKAVIAEEGRLVAIIEPEELRLKSLRDGWDAEQARIKAEAEAKELARIQAAQQRIAEIRSFVVLANNCRTSVRVQALLDQLAKLDMSGLDEFSDDGMSVLAETTSAVSAIHEARATDEAERVRIKAEQETAAAELAAQQAQLAAAKKELEELQASAKAAHEKALAEQAALAAAAEQKRQAAEIEQQRQAAEIGRQRQALADEAEKLAAAKIAMEAAAAPKLPEAAPEPDVEAQPATATEPQAAATVTLGQINALIAPLSISAEGLRTLSFEPAGKARSAVLYLESQVPAILAALIEHLQNAQ